MGPVINLNRPKCIHELGEKLRTREFLFASRETAVFATARLQESTHLRSGCTTQPTARHAITADVVGDGIAHSGTMMQSVLRVVRGTQRLTQTFSVLK